MKSPFRNIVVYDFETGGLNSQKHAVTEVAMVRIDGETLEITGSYTSLIKPYNKEYIDAALEVSGITMSMLEEEGKDVMEVIEEILDFLDESKSSSSKPILAGHNIDSFDNGFLEELFAMRKKKVDKYVNKTLTIDTLKWSRLKWLESPNFKLGQCCSNAGVVIKEAHRALPDTEANAKLVISFLKLLRGEVSAGEVKKERFRKTFKFEF